LELFASVDAAAPIPSDKVGTFGRFARNDDRWGWSGAETEPDQHELVS
jgi:hypothetical protein